MICRSVAFKDILFGRSVVLIDVAEAETTCFRFGDGAIDGVASGREDTVVIGGIGPLEGGVENLIDISWFEPRNVDGAFGEGMTYE